MPYISGLGEHIVRPTTVLGAAGTHNVWTIAGGPILITHIWGVLTILMDGTASTLRLEHEVGNVNLCGDLAAIANDPVGTVYFLTGVQADLLLKAEPAVGGATPAVAAGQHICAIAGDIHCTNGGDQTGSIEWHMTYIPLDEGVTVVNAAVY